MISEFVSLHLIPLHYKYEMYIFNIGVDFSREYFYN